MGSASTSASPDSKLILPNGYLHVEFDDQGTFEDYPFTELRSWKMQWGCLMLKFDKETILYPLSSIYRFTIVRNAFTEAEWKQYEEQTREPDKYLCSHCLGEIHGFVPGS